MKYTNHFALNVAVVSDQLIISARKIMEIMDRNYMKYAGVWILSKVMICLYS